MRKVVFILGAGASVHAGAPVMGTFLDTARRLRRGQRGNADADFERVFEAISKLQIVHSKATLDLVNLESVFGIFEMAGLLGVFPGLDSSEVAVLSNSMRVVILKTLEQSISYSVAGAIVQPPQHYKELAALVSNLSGSIITFNYDISLDFAFTYHDIDIDYGFSLESLADVGLFKLHGSANWVKCKACKKLNDQRFKVSSLQSHVTSYQLMADRNFIQEPSCSCGGENGLTPVIVPPSWDKTEYRSGLVNVWKRAAAAMAEATDIFVCGYSMPASDSFFHYLYALGSVGPSLLENFRVFDPDPKVEGRFRQLLGPGALQRFSFHLGTIENCLNSVEEIFAVEINKAQRP